MTGEFSAYECEEPMDDGYSCVRLYGHRGEHDSGTHRPADIPPEMWNQTLAGAAENLAKEMRGVRSALVQSLPSWIRKKFFDKEAQV